MQKLRNKIQEKKSELKLDNAELGLAIGRGERYIDRLLRDTVSTAKQDEIIGVLDELSCSSIAARLQIQSYLAAKSENIIKDYQDQIRDTQERYKVCRASAKEMTIAAGNMAEQFDRSAKQLAASVAQSEKLKEQIKNMAMQLTNVELDNKELQGAADNALKNILECRESASRKIQELESSLDQTGDALRFMKIMCIVLALISAVIVSTSFFAVT